MLESYCQHVADLAVQNVPPLPLIAHQMSELGGLLQHSHTGEAAFSLALLRDRVPPSVDQAAYVKAGFLTAIAKGENTSPLVSPQEAVELLGTMMGGYNVHSLIELLQVSDAAIAETATKALSKILLVYDAYHDVQELAASGNAYVKQVLDSWANADWFTSRPELPEAITVTVFKVPGEINTDDLPPAPHATTRPDIPLHVQVMLETRQPGSLETIADLKQKGHPVAYVGDVVGTGSSRKSAINPVLWHIGKEISFVPNQHNRDYIVNGKAAPSFFNDTEISGTLPAASKFILPLAREPTGIRLPKVNAPKKAA